MNIPQTTYPTVPTEALNGAADQSLNEDIISRTAENAVPVGGFVMLGTAAPGTTGVSPGQCKIIPDGTLVGALSALAGVALLDMARSPFGGTANTSSGSGQYAAGDSVPCMRRGRCWMYSETAVTQGNPVYVRVTAAGVAVTGQVRDGAAANFVLHPTAVFLSTTGAAGIALVEVK
jgi:hypothetical protein